MRSRNFLPSVLHTQPPMLAPSGISMRPRFSRRPQLRQLDLNINSAAFKSNYQYLTPQSGGGVPSNGSSSDEAWWKTDTAKMVGVGAVIAVLGVIILS